VRLGVGAALVDGALVAGDVEVLDGVVTAVGLAGGGGRGLAAPGFVDLQVNGFAGVDLQTADADGYARAGEALLATGVTAYRPTFVSAPAPTSRARSSRPHAPAPTTPPRCALRTSRCCGGCSTPAR
jgi:N-acetylglucosamine-6-phosphate deacetylase